MTDRAYYVVMAFRCRSHLDLDHLRDELTIAIESQYDVDGPAPVDVAVREVAAPREGKITSGQWGANGI